MFKLQKRRDADRMIAKFFFSEGIPFVKAKSKHYLNMCAALRDAPPGYVPPGYHKLRGELLVNAKADIDLQLADFDRRLANVGCTITSDGWDDAARHPLLNFLATAPDGVKFLDAVDTSGDVKDAVYISGKLLLAMDIVGRDNVVQVMTDGASACVAAGELVMQRWVASQHVLTPECCGWLFAVVCRCQPCSR